jgi:hypothetical protein
MRFLIPHLPEMVRGIFFYSFLPDGASCTVTSSYRVLPDRTGINPGRYSCRAKLGMQTSNMSLQAYCSRQHLANSLATNSDFRLLLKRSEETVGLELKFYLVLMMTKGPNNPCPKFRRPSA